MQYRDSVAGLQENWESCHGDDDWLRAVLMPFDWILGGWFLFLIIAVLVLISWLRYHKAIYPVMVGLLFFPAVYWRFPEHLITMGILLAFVAIGISIYYAFMRQTVE